MTLLTGARTAPPEHAGLAKAPTGIRGFDEITGGGLPRGRPTLVTGASGTGKTLFALEFLVRAARDFDEPGVLLAFEETASDLRTNVSSLGYDLQELERSGRLVIDAFEVDAAEIVSTGAFDLDGLFIRLALAVDAVGAKRVVLDTIEVLFSALGDKGIIRTELNRLFRWLKERELTTVVTGEHGRDGQLTRFGIEDYVSDCVVVLDHRLHDDISTRRMRVAKYRGSTHGTNEYPFLITDRGFVVLPVTSMGLSYPASTERITTGVPRLDDMAGGGIYRGTTVLISGSAGTGKTTLAAHMVDASCARGERALFVTFEESPDQLIRNMHSVGMDLGRWVDAGLLVVWAERATAFGLEAHLAGLDRLLDEHAPKIVVLDALASLSHIGEEREVTATVAREIDAVKARGITGVLTTLTHNESSEFSALAVSSLADTWLLLRNVESDAERNRLLFVIKSRGTAHSNQVREFVLTDHGAELLDVYVGPSGVVTGSARQLLLAETTATTATRSAEVERRRLAVARRTADAEAQIARLREQVAEEKSELEQLMAEESSRASAIISAQATSSRLRSSTAPSPGERVPDPRRRDERAEQGVHRREESDHERA